MASNEVRVEVDPREVRFLRSPDLAADLGCPPLLAVPISEVTRATAMPGPRGSRYLRVETSAAPAPEDAERDPRTAVFPKRQADVAEQLAAAIARNMAVHRGEPVGPIGPAGIDPKLMKAIDRSSSVALWAANVSLGLLIVPIVLFLIVAVAIVIAVL